MRFRGLPADMQTGPVEIRRETRIDLPFLACGFCKFYHVEYFLCDRGHVTCRDCGIDDLKRVRGDRATAPCFACGTRIPMTRFKVCEAKLKSEFLICPCGFQSGLQDIHKHLRDAKYKENCVVADKSFEEMELDAFKESLISLDVARRKVEFVEECLSLLFEKYILKPLENGKPDTASKIEKNIDICAKKIDGIHAIIKNINRINAAMLPTLEATFRYDSWLLLKLDDVMSESVNAFVSVISGIPLELRTQHEQIDGEPWLGIYLRGCVVDERLYQRKYCYPLKAKVTIRLHDARGRTAAVFRALTFGDGHFLCPTFADPSIPEITSGLGTDRFISFAKLRGDHVTLRGNLCFSFKFDLVDGNSSQ